MSRFTAPMSCSVPARSSHVLWPPAYEALPLVLPDSFHRCPYIHIHHVSWLSACKGCRPCPTLHLTVIPSPRLPLPSKTNLYSFRDARLPNLEHPYTASSAPTLPRCVSELRSTLFLPCGCPDAPSLAPPRQPLFPPKQHMEIQLTHRTMSR